MKPLKSIVLITALLSCTAISAHDEVQNYNQISLEATASADVENDTMIASLYAQEEGSRADQLADRVNTQINTALDTVRKHKSITVSTESYSTNPVYNKSQVIGWRVRQSLRLESTDIGLLSEVLGELQQQLKLNNISFNISQQRKEQQHNELIDQALIAFNRRAERIANRLQSKAYRIVSLHVSTSAGSVPYRIDMARTMLAEADAIAAPANTIPEIAGGNQTLTARVNGTIELE